MVGGKGQKDDNKKTLMNCGNLTGTLIAPNIPYNMRKT